MIEYQERLQDFYKMRDTLIAEGFNYPENIESFDKVEKREIALEIIINKNVHIDKLKNCFERNWNYETYNKQVTGYQRINEEEFYLLKEVLL